MKRLAVLALTAGLATAAAPASAADPVRYAVPASPGYAPTTPQVPAPYQRDRLGAGPVRTVAYDDRTAEGPRPLAALGGLFRRSPKESAETIDSYPADAAPRAGMAPPTRSTLPPPDGREFGAYGHPGQPVGSSCADGECVGGRHPDRSCWAKFTGWLCYRQTPNKLPLIPTPRDAPQYTYGVGRDGPSVGRAGCASGGCAHPSAAVGGPVVGPTVGEVMMPGYRLANPERPGVATPTPDASGTTTYYRPTSRN